MGQFGLKDPVFLSDWRVVRPQYESTQPQGFEWLAKAHAVAAARQQPGLDKQAFERRMRQALERFGCSDGQIARRGHELRDFLHDDWPSMEVFDVVAGHEQANLGRRMAFFAERCDEVLARLYPEHMDSNRVPDLMVHVTCTGYASPSPVQRLVTLRGWHNTTQATQAYHMGCYAAVPALRLAAAHLGAGLCRQVDLVHNELCTLHFDPSAHEPEQLVVQSLFADGHIAYSASTSFGSLRLLALGEELIPDSANMMTWALGAGGFRMTLARQVPAAIAKSIGDFVARLFQSAGIDPSSDKSRAIAAIHPGGPRIIDTLGQILGFDESALLAARGVLRDCGNMSSATLPHILARVAADPDVRPGTPILGLAFGPGLTMAGLVAVRS
jgi:predicted naringenin-chalcone synthase